MPSRQTEIQEGRKDGLKPLLKLTVLDSCELVWSDARIIEQIKLATIEDATLSSTKSFALRKHKVSSYN